jgi:hypothetical protein
VAAAAAAVFVAASALDPVPLYPDHPEIGSPLSVQAMAEPPLDLVIPAAGVVVLVALGWASSWAGTPAWPWARPPLARPRCSGRPAGSVGSQPAGSACTTGVLLLSRGVRPRPRLRRRAGGGRRHPAGLGR